MVGQIIQQALCFVGMKLGMVICYCTENTDAPSGTVGETVSGIVSSGNETVVPW